MKIKDNFLVKKDLTQLENLIYNNFPWYLQKEQVTGADDGYWLSHILYDEDVPKSALYNPIIIIFKSYLKLILEILRADGRAEYFIETNVYVVFPVYLLRQLRQHRHIVLFK